MKRTLAAAIVALVILGVLLSPSPILAARQARSQWSGVYTDAQAARGEAIYRDNCAGCHGLEAAVGELAPALWGAPFTAHWNDQTVGALYELMRVTMPVNSPAGFSRPQYADVLAFILKKNGYPSGRAELAAQADALRQIPFLARKP